MSPQVMSPVKSTDCELLNFLPSALLQQLQAMVIEFSTQQQPAFEANFIATACVDHTKLTDSDNCQARPYARVSNATTHPTQLCPAQAQCKHAPVARVSDQFAEICTAV